MPGHKQLGLGRHWHFVSVLGWILCGLAYVILLFATGEWHRFWPYSWAIFPQAFKDIVTYLSFDLPPTLPGQPYNALQMLTYGAVVFILAPFQILTGAAQSPAIEARFPWYVRMFGGRQWARSLHFLALLAFLVFIVVHVFMVVVHGFGKETAKMIFGAEVYPMAAAIITVSAIVGLVVLHWVATRYTLAYPRSGRWARSPTTHGGYCSTACGRARTTPGRTSPPSTGSTANPRRATNTRSWPPTTSPTTSWRSEAWWRGP